MNRKTPEKVIEKGNPKTEQAYAKFQREELIKLTKEKDEKENTAKYNIEKIKEITIGRGNHKYLGLHTHPYKKNLGALAFPSPEDLIKINDEIGIKESKGEVITQRDYNSGEIQGYTFLVKQKESKWDLALREANKLSVHERRDAKEKINNEFKRGIKMYKEAINKGPEGIYSSLKQFCEDEGWGLRFVPAKGYHLDKRTGNFEKEKKGIENIVASLIGVFGLTILLSSIARLTGFSINNVENPTIASIIIVFTFILLVTCYFIIKQEKGDKR